MFFLLAATFVGETIAVRSASELTVFTEKTPAGAVIVGRLTDDRGVGVVGARISLELDTGRGGKVHLETNAAGTFRAPYVGEPRRLEVKAFFDGNTTLEPTHAVFTFDTAQRQPTSIAFSDAPRVTKWLDAGAIEVRAFPRPREVLLRVSGMVIRLAPDAEGKARLPVESWRTAPGPISVNAQAVSARGDVVASTERTVFVTSAVRIDSVGDAVGGGCRITGTVRGDHGRVAFARLVVVSDGRPSRAAKADAQGRFEIELPCPWGSAGRRKDGLEIAFVPHEPGLVASRALVPFAEGDKAQGRILVVAFFVSALVAIGAIFVLAIISAVRRAVGRVRHATGRGDRRVDGEGTTPATTTIVSRTRITRRKTSYRVSGRIVDAVSLLGIPRPSVVVALGRPAETGAIETFNVEADDKGRFAFSLEKMGRLKMRFEADGYKAGELSDDVPHRGELDGLEVRLLSIREALRAAYRDGGRALAVAHDEIMRDSPAEIASRLAAAAPPPGDAAIAEFARAFEALFFGGGPRTARDLAAFEGAVARLPPLAPRVTATTTVAEPFE